LAHLDVKQPEVNVGGREPRVISDDSRKDFFRLRLSSLLRSKHAEEIESLIVVRRVVKNSLQVSLSTILVSGSYRACGIF
jgi:hypothetical protein